jgi:hypothetical protein|tara:strand:- start:117 stop:260 length:144 start_codon:yes stop_codon:yes gene_type:complete
MLNLLITLLLSFGSTVNPAITEQEAAAKLTIEHHISVTDIITEDYGF